MANPEKYKGRTLASQLSEARERRIEIRKQRVKNLRTGFFALSLAVPFGGLGAMSHHDSSAVMPLSGTSSTITQEPTTTINRVTTSITIFTKSESPSRTTLKPKETTTTGKIPSDPLSYDVIYQKASARFGIPPEILYGLHKVESDQGSGPIQNKQGSGAQGPMQFMPDTWKMYGIDGDGDGKADINNPSDAIFSAANLLSHYPSIQKGLEAYGTNVNHVIECARTRGYR